MKKPPLSTPLESHLQAILDQLDSQTWTLQNLFQALKWKGYPFLIILLSLPFCQPIQIPGFSTPFGVVLIFIGARMVWGRRILWPQWILKKQISTRLLKTVIQKSLWVFQKLRPLLYARWSWLCTDAFFYRLHGGFVMLMGLYLALPLPIPFSNLLAAWALVFVGLGLVEEDGFFICLGYGLGCIGVILLGFLIRWLHMWVTT